MNEQSRHHRTALAGIVLLLAANTAQSASHSPEFTDLNNSDPGVSGSVAYDLQKVVVLCATQPGSAEFDTAWTTWVKANPQADLDDTIRRVLSQAGTMRSMSGPGMAPTRPTRHPTPDAIAERMRWLASSSQSRGSVRVISAGSEIR
jgi:hypothetical protein